MILYKSHIPTQLMVKSAIDIRCDASLELTIPANIELSEGESVEIVGREGLTLLVKKRQ